MLTKLNSMKFRKKPVVIDAIQWKGDNLIQVIRFTGLNTSASHFKWDEYEQLVLEEGLKIFTLEGKMSAGVGDWIIKGVKGEFYPCKEDIFNMTYELAKPEHVPLTRDEAIKLAREAGAVVEAGLAPVFSSHSELVTFAALVESAHEIRAQSMLG
jgi:hypothetical protein